MVETVQLIFILVILNSYCHKGFSSDLQNAEVLFTSGNQSKAKDLYLNAAQKGSAEAHFAIAYKFITTREDRIYHYSEAAKKGHQKALEELLNEIFFRADDLVLSDPVKALEIYNEAKIANPNIRLYDEEKAIGTLKMAASVPPLDGKKFKDKYYPAGYTGYGTNPYFIWELAEKASQGKFNNKSSLLVLQLIIKGAYVPAELELVLPVYYKIWKTSDKPVPFNLCKFITSGDGANFCTERQKVEEDKNAYHDIEEIAKKMDPELKKLLFISYRKAQDFIEKKAWLEEDNDGSAFEAISLDSIMKQRKKFISLIKKVISGYDPPVTSSLEENKKRLNEKYFLLYNSLKKQHVSGMRASVDAEGLQQVQDLWNQYCQDTLLLFSKISKNPDKNKWENFLIVERLKDFNSLEELIESSR